MANKTTIALSNEQYQIIISTIKAGFVYPDQNGTEHKFRPNNQLATILSLETLLGIRISDIINLKLNSIVKDGNNYRLDITEQKTGKKRTFKVENNIYSFIQDYAIENGKKKTEQLFTISERAVQKQLKIVADYLGIENISTHSFRKLFATTVYTDSNHNIELVRELLQHSSTVTTQRYIKANTKEVETALNNIANKFMIV